MVYISSKGKFIVQPQKEEKIVELKEESSQQKDLPASQPAISHYEVQPAVCPEAKPFEIALPKFGSEATVRKVILCVVFLSTILSSLPPLMFIRVSLDQMGDPMMWFTWCFQLYWVWVGSHISGLSLPVVNSLDAVWNIYIVGTFIWAFELLVLNKRLTIKERALWLCALPLQMLLCVPILSFLYCRREWRKLPTHQWHTKISLDEQKRYTAFVVRLAIAFFVFMSAATLPVVRDHIELYSGMVMLVCTGLFMRRTSKFLRATKHPAVIETDGLNAIGANSEQDDDKPPESGRGRESYYMY